MTWVRKNGLRFAFLLLAAAVLLFLLLRCYGDRESARFERRRFHSYSARGLKPVRDAALPLREDENGKYYRYVVYSEDGSTHMVHFHILPLGKGFLTLGMEVTWDTSPGKGVYRSYQG